MPGQEGLHQGMLWAAHHGAQRLIQPGHARRLAGALSIAGLHQRRHGEGLLAPIRSGDRLEWLAQRFCAVAALVRQGHNERLCRLDHIAVDALGNAPASGVSQRALTLEDGRRGNAPVDALGRSAPGL